jgi:hypothetical protein
MRWALFSDVIRLDYLAGGGVPLDYGAPPTQIGLCGCLIIETQRDLLGGGIGCVAAIALVGQDRPDVAIEFDRSLQDRAEQRQCESYRSHGEWFTTSILQRGHESLAGDSVLIQD